MSGEKAGVFHAQYYKSQLPIMTKFQPKICIKPARTACEIQHGFWECEGYNLLLLVPGFHVAKSVKLENLDKTPTLGEITGVLNQYYMNLQPK